MRFKKVNYWFLFLLGFDLIGLNAQTMNIFERGGSHSTFRFIDIRNITFSKNNLITNLKSGTSEINNITDIRKITFSENGINLRIPIETQTNCMILYPIPVKDVLNFMHTSLNNIKGIAEILTIEGKVIYTQKINLQRGSNNHNINISGISQGIYIFRFLDERQVITAEFFKIK